MTPRDELQNASGAYALNALNDSERAEFENLMQGSEQLRNEVTELADTAVELGLSVAPVDPPASLRASVLDAIASTPQLAEERADGTGPQLAEERADGTRLEAAPDEHELAPAPTPAELKARARWGGSLVRIGAVAASIVLLVGLGFGIRAGVQMQSDLATQTQISQIQAAADSDRQTVDITGGGTATLVWSVALQRSALLVDGLKGLPAGSTYELWYIDGSGTATPAGTFDVASDGTRSVVLAGQMDAGDTIGVTVEPAGGSKTPTTDPVIVVQTA